MNDRKRSRSGSAEVRHNVDDTNEINIRATLAPDLFAITYRTGVDWNAS